MASVSLIIAGPTGVGKTEVALQVAERCGGEIVGADAFQVYEGLDLLTAKPTPEERARLPHHLIGHLPPGHTYDVAQYLAEARRCLTAIHARGRVPVVVGGTGLYLRALLYGLADLPPADPELRAELSRLPLAELQAKLQRCDPRSAAVIDLQNPRRLIRALEVCRLTGKPFSSFRTESPGKADPGFTGFTLVRERTDLYERINQRVEAMFRAGVEEEVAQKPALGSTAAQVLGLREIHELLQGRISRAECIALIQQATRRYAKRQLTWLRKESALQLRAATSPTLMTEITNSAQVSI